MNPYMHTNTHIEKCIHFQAFKKHKQKMFDYLVHIFHIAYLNFNYDVSPSPKHNTIDLSSFHTLSTCSTFLYHAHRKY